MYDLIVMWRETVGPGRRPLTGPSRAGNTFATVVLRPTTTGRRDMPWKRLQRAVARASPTFRVAN